MMSKNRIRRQIKGEERAARDYSESARRDKPASETYRHIEREERQHKQLLGKVMRGRSPRH